MKRVAMMAKAFNVETPVLNMVFLGYFVLLVVTAGFVIRHADDGKTASAVTATTQVQGNNNQN